jgi:hypothetical protein
MDAIQHSQNLTEKLLNNKNRHIKISIIGI